MSKKLANRIINWYDSKLGVSDTIICNFTDLLRRYGNSFRILRLIDLSNDMSDLMG